MKPALLVIDVQKAFAEEDPEVARSFKNAIWTINEAIALFREKGLPVICIQHMNEGDKIVPGVPGFEVPEDLKILPTDLHIHKKYGNSFNHTPLMEKLTEQGVDTVILTGYCAEYCVLSTYRGARDLDLAAVILRGSLASGTAKHIRFVETISELVSLGALTRFLA